MTVPPGAPTPDPAEQRTQPLRAHRPPTPPRAAGPPSGLTPHPWHPSASTPKKRDVTKLALLAMGLVGVVAVVGVVVTAVNGIGSPDASENASSGSSSTALGCDPDSDAEEFALCTENGIAKLPWCGVDLYSVAPMRVTNVGRGPNAPDTYTARYRLGSGSVDFLWIPDSDSLTAACGAKQRTVTGAEFVSLYEAGSDLPASLR